MGLAEKVDYMGSGEHKRYPNPLCPASLRSNASDCDAVDPSLSQDKPRLLRWLREAMRRGQADRRSDNGYPRYLWGWVVVSDGKRRLFEARLTNEDLGHYKGYFIEPQDLIGKKAWTKTKLEDGGEWWEIIP